MTLDELLAAARADPGSTSANRQFWKALEHEIDGCFARYNHSRRIDLTQRTLLVVWRKIDRYQQTGSNSLRRWVRVIAANEARYTRLRAARLVRLESKLLRETAMSRALTPSSYVLESERLQLVDQALQKMSPAERTAIGIGDSWTLSQTEQIRIDAARMRLHRAIRKLARLIEDMRKTKRVRIVTSS